MSIINGYATLSEYKNYATARGQTTTTDATDDAIIESMIQSVARLIDQQTRRKFYPRITTQYFDIPYDRRLWFRDDLLALTTLTNGDTTALTQYKLEDYNHPPYYALKLADYSSQIWQTDSNGSAQNVIQVAGEWGYHDEYAERAWVAAGTLGAAMTDTTGLTATLTGGHIAVTGRTYKIGSEIITGSVAANTLTILKRGDNGSAAATHSNGATILMWSPMDVIHDACLQTVMTAYKRRNGVSETGTATITPAGVVITPDDIPANVMRMLRDLRTLV